MSIQRSSNQAQCSDSLGFSLVELMVVVAVVAILGAIAISSYTKYVVTTNRAAATGCLSQYANYMERYYTTNLRYDQAPASSSSGAATPNPATGSPSPMALDCASTAQTGTNYSYSVPAPTATTYTIQATPINAQLTRDTQCGTLAINQLGQHFALGTNQTTTLLAQCWGG